MKDRPEETKENIKNQGNFQLIKDIKSNQNSKCQEDPESKKEKNRQEVKEKV